MMQRLFQRSFEPPGYHSIRHSWGTFWGGKYHITVIEVFKLSKHRSIKNWEGCRLRWNSIWNAKIL